MRGNVLECCSPLELSEHPRAPDLTPQEIGETREICFRMHFLCVFPISRGAMSISQQQETSDIFRLKTLFTQAGRWVRG
jgi:hypothetical protein